MSASPTPAYAYPSLQGALEGARATNPTPAVSPCLMQQRIDRFADRFSAVGNPSIRSIIKDFIAQHQAEHGSLPRGRHLLVTGDRTRGFVGPTVDFTHL